jgi:hypothetical protein
MPKKGLFEKVDGSKLDVIQEGFIGAAPPMKVNRTEELSEPEVVERVRLIEFLKKTIDPKPISKTSTPRQDKELLYRKLDHMDLATARKFYQSIPESIVKDIRAGEVVEADIETSGELNVRYQDISP